MSGHSKWSQIKRQKGVADVRRGALYTKLGHAVALAVREGGKDPTMNMKLRLALEKAKQANMPNATIERAIKRGAGELGAKDAIAQVTYEGFGPGGVALMIETVTDNKNRTAAEIRHLFSSHGGTTGSQGSVQWMFDTRGKIFLTTTSLTDEQELALIDAGMQDVKQHESGVLLLTRADALENVKTCVERLGLPFEDAELGLVPKTPSDPLQAEERKKLQILIEELESLDDVTAVTTNAPS